jgi:S1-C subfamily serine protease
MVVGVFATIFVAVTAALKFNEQSKTRSSIFSQAPARETWIQNAGLDSVPQSLDFRLAAKKILPSVVSVDTQVEGENFFGERVVQDYSQGSGVIVSADGYIVTNNHVIRAQVGFGRSQIANRVLVHFSDGKSAEAKVIGTDPRSDLAVLKVDRSGLSPIQVGDSSKVEVGQWVIAVGNPLGFENTLSVGVVSNVGRQLPGSGDAVFIDGIQTDAAINHGNSGGALCTSDGSLVGINSSIASTTNANIGIGFAIPSKRMKQVVDDIIKFGYAKYGQLGVQVWKRPDGLSFAEAREELKSRTSSPGEPPSQGCVVLDVSSGSPAETAGLKPLDVITEINNQKIVDFVDFQKILSPMGPSAEVNIKVWSAGKVKSIKAVLTDVGKASL